MRREQKALCLIFALFITIFFLSGLLLTLEHDCTQERCQVCAFMTSIKKILATLCLILTACGGMVVLLSAPSIPAGCLVPQHHAITPITLKVKLSD